ncbi:MAG: serine/threonine-protein kinase [Deltaproteobacteria bacterium]|nr:serine/threonine-protein kinase [Deltaproteobacteria bacterium]
MTSEELSRLRQVLLQNPLDRNTRLQLGRLLAQDVDLEAACDVLGPLVRENAQSSEPDDEFTSEAVLLVARLETRSGRQNAASVLWQRLLADNIDHPEARTQLARMQSSRRTPLPPAAPRNEATLVSPQGVSAGRYQLVREIGRGATSTVYMAVDHELALNIALKVLHPELGATNKKQARERFFWEARAAARLRHPGVVAVYDLDERTRSLAMEYLPGGTLRSRISETSTPIPIPEILETGRKLLETLAFVHESGLVHGDLKPRNILLRAPGLPVLADFGVARLVADDPRNAHGPAGTPLFLAPEQLQGAPPSPATDLFAVGAVLWEMVAGRPMRTLGDLVAGRHRHASLPAESIKRSAGVPMADVLFSLLIDLTALTPADRPESARRAAEMIR